MNYAVEQSILYAWQLGNDIFTTNAQELRVGFKVLLVSGYAKLSRRKMYREQEDDVYNHAVADAKLHNKFLECLKYF